MNHIMIDCYGCNKTLLEDIRYVNKVMNEIPYILELNAVNPPNLIPYYYGKVKEDDGVSAFVMLEGGHLTIHTFPLRKCYFLDIYSPYPIDSKVLEDYLLEKLPYNPELSNNAQRDRNIKIFDSSPYDENDDFGPHVLAVLKVEKKITLDFIYNFLENLVVKIGMTPIMRPCVIKSTIGNPKYLSGITMIAESHISLHYDFDQNIIFADIFSCCPFDYSSITKIYEEFGKVESYEVVARGTKHYSIIANTKADIERASSEKWKQNIYK